MTRPRLCTGAGMTTNGAGGKDIIGRDCDTMIDAVGMPARSAKLPFEPTLTDQLVPWATDAVETVSRAAPSSRVEVIRFMIGSPYWATP
jgi:hypothetical protein